ncbi:MAG: hypothetical protein E6Q97_02995 [Desulfurellales bacterium]|nr:MAG: hypothetical protein E6Q97_02995 [Desulfurellales bacterium]
MPALNTYSAVSSLAQSIQDDAIFIVREMGMMSSFVTTFTDASGLNPRKGYQYNSGTALTVGEADDLVSYAFTPSLDQTLTPAEIGLQFFVTDSRVESELPESWASDASQELGLAALDKLETDLIGDIASLTGGTIGTAGSAITWGYVSAAIAQARNANKNAAKPLIAVIHGYQWAVLAKAASVAGASVVNAPQFQDQLTRTGGASAMVATFMGVPIYQTFQAVDANSDFTGGVFPREAIALDWRRPVRVRPERDESRRGTELNMSAVYAHGVWRPTRGVKMIFDATAPTS